MTDKQKELLSEYLKLQDEVENDKIPLQAWCDFVNGLSTEDGLAVAFGAMKVYKAERLANGRTK
jgi:hypothetical protein